MTQINQQVDQILNKQLSRKEFLKHVGIAAVGLAVGAGVVRLFFGDDSKLKSVSIKESDLDPAILRKLNRLGIVQGGGVISVAGKTGANISLNKKDVGLGNVDNTADANKPISDAVKGALDNKASRSHKHTIADTDGLQEALDARITTTTPLVSSVANKTGDVTLTKNDVGLSNVDNTSDLNKPISSATQTALDDKEVALGAGTTSDYLRGDKSWQTLDKTAVGLANIDNTSDLNKPISLALAQLVQWARNIDQLIVGTITRDSNNAVTSAPVIWPDGTVGTYTADTVSVSFPGVVDAYHVTYGSPVTKTFTQPVVTRNASGAVTSLPAIVVT